MVPVIQSSETRNDGSCKGKSLATWHCSNVGNSLLLYESISILITSFTGCKSCRLQRIDEVSTTTIDKNVIQ